MSEFSKLKDYKNDYTMTEWILFEMSFGQKYNVNTENGSWSWKYNYGIWQNKPCTFFDDG